jgi:negative regulator of sigma E activity
VASATALAAVLAAAFPAAAELGPLDRAREAAEQASFSGTVTLRWTDDAGPHTQILHVDADRGVLLVDGATSLLASSDGRFASHDGRAWDLLWPSGVGAGARPGLGAKYSVRVRPGPEVAGRPTTMTEVVDSGQVRERLYIDEASQLLLRREQLDGTEVARSVAFDSIGTRTSTTPRAVPVASVTRSTTAIRSTRLPKPYLAPRRLAAGYRRIGAYRTGETVQVLFSDGLYDLSVFEQPGRLGSTPSEGRRVRVGDRNGNRLTWAGGAVVVWQAGDAVFTVVGDGPQDEVLAVARSLPVRTRLSPLDRVRRALRRALDPVR